MKRLLTSLWLCLLPMTATLASDSPPASEASIRQLLELTQPQRSLEVMRAQIDRAFEDSYKAGLGDTQLTPRQQEIVDHYRAQMTEVMNEQLDWKALEPVILDVYGRTFTQAEINDIAAFYRTPSGRALLEKMPRMMQSTMEAMQQRTRTLVPRLQALTQEMATKLREARTEP